MLPSQSAVSHLASARPTAVRQGIKSGDNFGHRRGGKLLLALRYQGLSRVDLCAIEMSPVVESEQLNEQHAGLSIRYQERLKSLRWEKCTHRVDKFCRRRSKEARCLKLYAAGCINHVSDDWRSYYSFLSPGDTRTRGTDSHCRIPAEAGGVGGDSIGIAESLGNPSLPRKPRAAKTNCCDHERGMRARQMVHVAFSSSRVRLPRRNQSEGTSK
jgi:hypothetical protein